MVTGQGSSFTRVGHITSNQNKYGQRGGSLTMHTGSTEMNELGVGGIPVKLDTS